MTVHLLRGDTFVELITQLYFFPFCLDTAIILMIMKRFIKFWLGSHFDKSLLFCVLLDGDPDIFRIRDKEEPQHYPPKEHNNANGVQKPLPVFIDFKKLGT